jgi:hypothetical protein
MVSNEVSQPGSEAQTLHSFPTKALLVAAAVCSLSGDVFTAAIKSIRELFEGEPLCPTQSGGGFTPSVSQQMVPGKSILRQHNIAVMGTPDGRPYSSDGHSSGGANRH